MSFNGSRIIEVVPCLHYGLRTVAKIKMKLCRCPMSGDFKVKFWVGTIKLQKISFCRIDLKKSPRPSPLSVDKAVSRIRPPIYKLIDNSGYPGGDGKASQESFMIF